VEDDGQWAPQINLGVPVLIPEDYVPDLDVRLGLYRRLSQLHDKVELEGFAAELIDRFGKLPREVNILLTVVRIKEECRKAGISRSTQAPRASRSSSMATSTPIPRDSWSSSRGRARRRSRTTRSSSAATGRSDKEKIRGAFAIARDLTQAPSFWAPSQRRRAGAGRPPEPPVTRELSAAARAHSQDMDNRDFFSHTNPDGVSASGRAMAAGHGSTFVGENIGWIGSSSTNFNTQTRVEAHHANLWASDGHQRNLMFADWTEIGVGYDYGDYRGFAGSTFVTEMFGARGVTYLTGVVIADGDGDNFYDIGEGLGGVRITATNGSATYATETWGAGGYTLALPSGAYDVRFEGGGLPAPVLRQVTIGTRNVKLDVIVNGAAQTLSEGPVGDAAEAVEVLDAAPETAPAAADVLAGFPSVPMPDLPPEEVEEEMLA
jgi:hypothetical protein